MRADELRGQTADELRSELRQLRRRLFDLKFQFQAEESSDTSAKKKLRRDIARHKTVLRELELADSGQQ